MNGTQTLFRPHAAALPSAWTPYAVLAAGVAVWLMLFNREAADAVDVWLGSTAYNHCFLVIPIVAYLIWDRRAALAGFAPDPAPALALLAIPVSFGWFVAERIGFMEGRQLVAMTGLELLFLCVLGPRACRRILGPLLYLYFLVPFGDFLTPSLQQFTTGFVMHGLDLLGIPNFTDGLTIQIPEGTFVIAEACAGLRFLIAAVAFGCLYALLIYRSAWKRLIFIAVSLVVPVIANGFRALGIVTLGHLLGSAQAAETDHILYGWIFFSIVLLILIVLGLPFREDMPGRQPPRAPAAAPRFASAGRFAAAAAASLALLGIGPAAAETVDSFIPGPVTAFPVAVQPPCTPAQGTPALRPSAEEPPGPRGALVSCSGVDFLVHAERFTPRTPPRPIVKTRDALAGLGLSDVELGHFRANGLEWLIARDDSPASLTASLIWTAGQAADAGLRFRVRRGLESLTGGGSPVVVMSVAAAHPVAHPDEYRYRQQMAALDALLRTQTWIPAALEAASPGLK